MGINVYLRGQWVTGLPGFETLTIREGNGNAHKRHSLPGIALSRENGRWYIRLGEITDPIPSILADLVDEITMMEYATFPAKRELGIYRLGSAEASVGPEKIEGRIKVFITSKTMEDLRELYRQILAGTIRPEVSYENEQEKPAEKESERPAQPDITDLVEDLRGLCLKLFHRRWRYINAVNVGNMIDRVLIKHNL